MLRQLPLVLLLSAVIVAAGCEREDASGFAEFTGDFAEFTGDVEGAQVLVDMVHRAAGAEVIREVSAVEVGAPDSVARLISGWDHPEPYGDSEWMVWAVSTTAVVEFVLLDTAYKRLDLRCRAFSWEGAPDQVATVVINGEVVGGVALRPSFSDHSVRIPSGVLGLGTNRIELIFDWTAKPSDHLPQNTDERGLAAAFQRLALAPASNSPDDVSMTAVPVVSDDGLKISSGTGLRYRFSAPENGFLEFEVQPSAVGEAQPRLRVWMAYPGQPAVAVTHVDPSAPTRGSRRLAIDAPTGEPVEIGFAAIGSGGRESAVTVTKAMVAGTEGTGGAHANILLVEIDTLRADHLGCYGGDIDTPIVDAIAAQGVRFAHARSHIPITGPSHATLFTSLLPMEHGVLNNAQELRRDFPTLAETLRSSGRHTSAVISLGVLQRQFGFKRGFDRYGDGFPRDWLKDAAEVTDEVLALADSGFWEPYFLWVHYADPHEPYAPSDDRYPHFDLRLDGESIGVVDAGGRGFRFAVDLPSGDSVLEFIPIDEGEPGRVYRVDNLLLDDPEIVIEAIEGWNVIPRRMSRTTYESQMPASVRLTNPGSAAAKTGMLVSCKKLLSKPEIREAYAGEVEFVDRQIGRLMTGLEERGLLEDTLVVFFSDHGEGLGNHDHVGHISQLYDSLIHVPLIFSWPGRLPEGLVIDASVSLIDVFPTISELLDLDGPDRVSGASLVPLMRGEDPPARPVIAATYRPESFSDKRAIVVDGFKYIHSWKDEQEKEELFDVVIDPGELTNLVEERPEVLSRLRNELAKRLAEMAQSAPVEVELSEEDKAQLRALGYLH